MRRLTSSIPTRTLVKVQIANIRQHYGALSKRRVLAPSTLLGLELFAEERLTELASNELNGIKIAEERTIK